MQNNKICMDDQTFVAPISKTSEICIQDLTLMRSSVSDRSFSISVMKRIPTASCLHSNWCDGKLTGSHFFQKDISPQLRFKSRT